jgi:hypothetical protein
VETSSGSGEQEVYVGDSDKDIHWGVVTHDEQKQYACTARRSSLDEKVRDWIRSCAGSVRTQQLSTMSFVRQQYMSNYSQR